MLPTWNDKIKSNMPELPANPTIKQIYDFYPIPPNLQNHMLTVANVVFTISQNWIGPSINKRDLILAALLHDVGNLAKFDLNKPVTPLRDIAAWQLKQKQF